MTYQKWFIADVLIVTKLLCLLVFFLNDLRDSGIIIVTGSRGAGQVDDNLFSTHMVEKFHSYQIFCFVCVGVLRPCQQRGHVEPIINSGTVPGQA